MKLRTALVTLLAASLAVLLWAWFGGGSDERAAAALNPSNSPPVTSTPASPRGLARANSLEREEARPESASRVTLASEEAKASLLESWGGQLAGVAGRIVDSNGDPQVGMRVELLQVDWTLMTAGDLRDLGNEVSMSLGRDKTDDEGRFHIDGAWNSAYHGLGIDLGGQRSSLRVLDQSLKHGELTDLGDIVLAPCGTLLGKVVDERGKPLAGARVRVGALPRDLHDMRLYDLRPNTLIAVSELLHAGQPEAVIAIPGWLRKHLDSLPVPTVKSGADGRFRLEGVPLGRVHGGIDLRGFASLPLGPIEVGEREHDLGRLTMSRGRTLSGVVLDAAGEAVEGAEVYAGAELPLGGVAFLDPCGTSDRRGGFHLRGVPAEGLALAVARRGGSEPFVATFDEGGGPLEIRLAATVDIDVRVVDGDGLALSEARLQLTPMGDVESRVSWNPIAFFSERTSSPLTGFREVEEGLYRRTRVSVGTYELRAEVKGYAAARARVEVGEGADDITLTCGAGQGLTVTVLDADSGEAVPGARVTILQSGLPLVSTLALGWSDVHGRVELGPFAFLEDEDAARSIMGVQPPLLMVEHPDYPMHEEEVTDQRPTRVVRLRAGGALEGRIHWGGATPERRYMLMTEFRSAGGVGELFHMPRLATSDGVGNYHFEDLCAGKYRIEVLERFLNEDVFGLSLMEEDPVQVYEGEFEVKSGVVTRLDIDLSPLGIGPSARIVGSLRVDGLAIPGARVQIYGSADSTLVTDWAGRFESQPFSIQRAPLVIITADLSRFDGGAPEQQVYKQSIKLEAGDVKRIDLDLQPHYLWVEVLDAHSGSPLPNVLLMAQRNARGGSQRTSGHSDSTGRALLMVLDGGRHSLEARLDGFKTQVSKVKPVGKVSTEFVRMKLTPSVACAGRVVISDSAMSSSDGLFLHLSQQGGSSIGNTLLTGERLEFSFADLEPGTYEATLYADGSEGLETTFELGARGNLDLVLRF